MAVAPVVAPQASPPGPPSSALRRVFDAVHEGNDRVGGLVTRVVGTMACAYVFTALALYGLPTALKGGPSALVLWTSSEFIQLVMLAILQYASNKAARSTDDLHAKIDAHGEAMSHHRTELAALHASLDRLHQHFATAAPDGGTAAPR